MHAWLLEVTLNKEKSFIHQRNYWFVDTTDLIYWRLYLLFSDYWETAILLKEVWLDIQGRGIDIHFISCKPLQRAALGFNWLKGGVRSAPPHTHTLPFYHRGHWNWRDYKDMAPGCPFHHKWNWKQNQLQHEWTFKIQTFILILDSKSSLPGPFMTACVLRLWACFHACASEPTTYDTHTKVYFIFDKHSLPDLHISNKSKA